MKKILSAYNLYPASIERVSEKVYKVSTTRNQFALKQTSMTQEEIQNWHYLYELAYEQQHYFILPVYVTRNQTLFVEYQDLYFYLSPWIEKKEKRDFQSLLKDISKLHSKTLSEREIDRSVFKGRIEEYKGHCHLYEKKLMSFVETFEQSHYMSPLELQVCTHFHQLSLALHLFKENCNYFLEEASEEDFKKWQVSYCHGQLSTEHYLIGPNQAYFINWERSSYNYPLFDLAHLFIEEMKRNPTAAEELRKGFDLYTEAVPLKRHEWHLLNIYLLNPSRYIQTLETTISNKDEAMLEKTKRLEKQFRPIVFGIELAHFMKEKNL